MTPTPDTSPPPFSLHVDAPDTPSEREWLVGWCHCLAQPLLDGQLLPDPWIWPTLGTTAAAWVLTGPGPARAKMTVRDDWLISDHGADPLRVSFVAIDGVFRCTLTLHGPLFAHLWAREELAIYLKLARFVRSSYDIHCDDSDWLSPILLEDGKGLLKASSKGLYWRVCQFRKDLRRAPSSPAVARDRAWLDGTIRALIDEELHRGLLHPNAVRSSHVDMLDVLHTPADRLSAWELPHLR